MKDNNAYQTKLKTANKPTLDEAKALQNTHFNYRQAIGEVIDAMVTCQPDISYTVIKLAQYSTNPAAVYYQAVQHLLCYLALTKDQGIYYWRKQPVQSLPHIQQE